MTDPARAKPRFFDLWSTVYDAPLVQRLTYRPVQDAVLAALHTAAGSRVLDLGCGTGLLTDRLRRERPGVRVVGCDFSSGMLRRAAARSAAVAWVRGDAQRLPFREGSLDAVVCTEAFHWFPDPDAALDEIARVLVPGGRLLVALVNVRAEWMTPATHAASALLGEPAHWPTRRRMRARVERAGLRVREQRAIFRIPLGVLLPPVLTVAERPAGGATSRA